MRTEDITLNHIKILKVVNECGSFSKAAQQLKCSQALISKKVKQIEDCFGTQLLTRSPRSACLTYKGEKLIAQTQNVVENFERLQTEFQINLSAEGETLLLGVTSLLEIWLDQNFYRFRLCFPNRRIKKVIIENNKFFLDLQAVKFDALVNSSPAYREKHHCTRLQTHHLLLIAFNTDQMIGKEETVQIGEIEFTDIVLLEEIYQELSKYQHLSKFKLDKALVFNNYQQMIEFADENHKQTILPDFCQASITEEHQVATWFIQGVNEYGTYIHIPPFGELLVSAESLVRSFRLDQDSLDSPPQIRPAVGSLTRESSVIRVGIQRDSIGQLIASYGTKYISSLLKQSSSNHLNVKNIEIDRNFDLQIIPFTSGEQINKQMKRGEIDICILDDVSLLNNGFRSFNDFSFGSKLIGIASYNLLGQDISIVIPKSSSIDSVYGLRGRRISTLFGSNSHRFIITLFDLYGMDVSKDCKLIDEDPHTAGTSLLNGNTDAYICCNTYASILTECAFAKKLDSEQSHSIKLPSLRGIVSRSQFIKENPKFIIAYLHDLVIANYWFTSNSTKAIAVLSDLIGINKNQIAQFFNFESGSRIDPTLKPQWSWLLKTLNRRLDGKYDISLFDVDFWIEDYFLRLVYNLLELDYHFQQISFSSELSNSYFIEEKFSRYSSLIL